MALKLRHLYTARFLPSRLLPRRFLSSTPPVSIVRPNFTSQKYGHFNRNSSNPLFNFPLRLMSTEAESNKGLPLGKLDGKFNLIYTCGVCSHRNSHLISKQAYEKGVVIVTCEGCKNRHLIADHLGWFQDFQEKTIEEMMAKKGQVVQRVNPVYEYTE